jgi:hypothetical protein
VRIFHSNPMIAGPFRQSLAALVLPIALAMLAGCDLTKDADSVKVALDGLEGVHGIALKDGFVYLASVNKVMRSLRSGDGTLAAPEFPPRDTS